METSFGASTMHACKVFRPILGLLLPLVSSTIFAQEPQPRLLKPIADNARVVLPASRSPRVLSAQDLGPVSTETLVHGITLVFRRSAAQEADLQTLLTALQNPSSPQYHRWLTTEDFANRFGVADKDIAATESWLVSHGFQMEGVARSRDRITFSGTAAQVQSAFGTDLHQYRVEGETHFAPMSDLTLPAELASVTAAVLHLSDFRPKPSWKALPSVNPNLTAGTTNQHYLLPGDVATMYNTNPSGLGWDFFKYGGVGFGQSIAIVGQSYINTQTIDSNIFKIAISRIIPVLVPGSGVQAISPGDMSESEIDLEYSSGVAQSAQIVFVYVGINRNYSVFDAMAYAITENLAPVVSISYGECEPLMSASELDAHNALFQQAAAQGQTLVASSGDSGSTACAPYSSSIATVAQKQQVSVNFPASSPYVTAVGGTQMAPGTFTAGSSPYWADSNGSEVTSSLLSYVPEVTWNEGTAGYSPLAGGGGTSSHYPMPAWQSSYPGMPTGTYRMLPDISLLSAVESPGFVFCTSDPYMLYSEGQTGSCTNGLLGSNGKYTIAGGTSFAAPIFAAFIASLNAAEQVSGQGNINPQLYALAANPGSHPSPFHDITSGTIACITGATNCVSASQSSYPATSGYDQATGLGSVDFKALVDAWPVSNNKGLQTTWINAVNNQAMASPGETVPVTISLGVLQTIYGYPTMLSGGNLSISVDDTIVNPSLAFTQANPLLAQATAQFDFVVPATTGSHVLTARYSGDATHSAATSITSIAVGNVQPSGTMTMSVGNLTVANGGTGTADVTVTPTGYTGRLFWSLSVTATSASNLSGCYGISPLAVDSTSPATTKLTIGVGKACTSAQASSRAAFRTIGQGISTNEHRSIQWRKTSASAVCAGLLLCGGLARRRRKWLSLLMLVILLIPVAEMNLMGCGGGSKSDQTTPTPPPPSTKTTYTLTLTGTDSVNTSLTVSASSTLTVTQ
jgi:subtilase family serine protease